MLESTFKKMFIEQLKNHMLSFGIELDIIKVEPPPRSFPDILVLGPRYWAALEFKREDRASHQPNQDYHVQRLSSKGYSSFVHPDNAEEVLHDLEGLFTT